MKSEPHSCRRWYRVGLDGVPQTRPSVRIGLNSGPGKGPLPTVVSDPSRTLSPTPFCVPNRAPIPTNSWVMCLREGCLCPDTNPSIKVLGPCTR